MLNKAGEGKAVIMWKLAVRFLESLCPQSQSRLWEESYLAVPGPALTTHPTLSLMALYSTPLPTPDYMSPVSGLKRGHNYLNYLKGF